MTASIKTILFLFLHLQCFFFTSFTTISPSEKQFILDTHNEYRSLLAQGRTPSQPPATDMNFLFWDDGLAAASQEWVSQCIYDYDPNPGQTIIKQFSNLTSFTIPVNLSSTSLSNTEDDNMADYIGENFRIGVNLDEETDIATGLLSWYSESDYTYSNIYQSNARYYTQMIWSKTRYIGCGYNTCENGLKSLNGSVINGDSSTSTALFQCYYFPSMFMHVHKNYSTHGTVVENVTIIGYPYEEAISDDEICSNCDLDRCICDSHSGLCSGCMNKDYYANNCDKIKNEEAESESEENMSDEYINCGISTDICCDDGLGVGNILADCENNEDYCINGGAEMISTTTQAATTETATETATETIETTIGDTTDTIDTTEDNTQRPTVVVSSSSSTTENSNEKQYEWQDIPWQQRKFEVWSSMLMRFEWEVLTSNITFLTMIESYDASEVTTWDFNQVEFEMTNYIFQVILFDSINLTISNPRRQGISTNNNKDNKDTEEEAEAEEDKKEDTKENRETRNTNININTNRNENENDENEMNVTLTFMYNNDRTIECQLKARTESDYFDSKSV